VQERESGGAFQSVEELERVKGIGPVTVDEVRPFLVAD
jgi:DNA uptake protein ComE-like DNA-binding protein